MLLGKKTGAPDWLVVGLGNPGLAYEGTRHNAGLGALTALARDCGVSLSKRQFHALTAVAEVAGQRLLLLFPQTFMNNSGEAVAEAARFYKLPAHRVLVFSDDIALAVGAVRVRRKGSDGGQKGLRSISACLGTDDFPRIRIGVGAKPHPAYDLADWVLSRFPKEEQPLMQAAFDKAADAAKLVVAGEIDQAMNRYSK